jgi:hypothetical protein
VREGACTDWGCYYATALDIEVDPQRCCFGSRQSYFALQAFVSVYFVVTYSSTGPRKRFREMIAAHGGGHGKGFPARSYPELLSGLEGMCTMHAVTMLWFWH